MDVGERLRRVRENRGLSQRELARRVGVTNSSISLIEQNKVSPSVSSLKRVLDGIPISIADFFTLDLDRLDEGPFYPHAQQPDVGNGGIHYFLVGHDRANRQLCLLRELMPPGSDTGEAMLSHDGEEGGVVVRGRVEVQVGEQVRVLEAGEGYYFDCRLPHRFRNVGEDEALIVSASTPPTF